MGLSRTVSEIDGDFSRKSQNFPTYPGVFCAPLKGFPLELGACAGIKKPEWWGYRAEEDVWRYLQLCGYNTPTWQTDRQTDGRKEGRTGQTPDDSKVRRLHIASRGKKNFCIPLASVPPNTVCIARSDIDKKTNLFNLNRDFVTKFALFRTGDNKTVKSETDRKCEAVRQFVADTYLNRKHWLPRGFFSALCKGINA